MKAKNNIFLKIISNIEVALASVMLIILVVLTFTGVIMRYCFGNPFTWLEEIQLACMVWIVFAAAGSAFRYGGHVSIEIVADMLPGSVRKTVEVLISAVVVIVVVYFGMKSITYIQLFLRTGRGTPILKIPYAWIYGIVPVSCVLMLVNWFVVWFQSFKNTEGEEEIS